MTQWNILFWIASGVYVFGALVFLFLIDSEPEKWGFAPKSKSGSTTSTVYSISVDNSEKQSTVNKRI